eukprot:m.190296 g.190296  ORF g.190296 m.190296 type:complete len:616 (-) comp18225_c0_seq5:99-1946(-)
MDRMDGEPESQLQLEHATFSLASERAGHGCYLKLRGTNPRHARPCRGEIDVLGSFSHALPPGGSSLMAWLLPLKLRNFPASDFRGDRFEARFGLGLYRLSHTTLLSRLQGFATAGDPVIMLEIADTDTAQVLTRFPTRASLISAALENDDDRNIVYRGARCAIPRRSAGLRLFRWWLLPLLALAGIAWMTLRSASAVALVPSLLPHTNRSIATALPPYPESMMQAWNLGGLLAQLNSTSSTAAAETLLQQAANITGRDSLTLEQLQAIPALIEATEAHTSILARARGMFSFINLIWLVSIVGIAVSIGPSVYHITKPIQDWLKRVCKQVLDRVIIPFARWAHENGVFELVAYTAALTVCVDGIRMPREYGEMVTLSGIVALAPCMAYSTFLHGGSVIKRLHPDTVTQMMSVWYGLCWFPFAIYYQSTLMAYASTALGASALGFGVACYGMCYVIGFRSKNALQRATVTAGLVLDLLGLAVVLDMSGPKLLAPFASPMTVLGGVVHFMGLLIISSRWYHHDTDLSYTARQALFIGSTGILAAAGFVLGFPGMANTATVFTVLYCMEKYTEFHLELKWNGWVLMLMLSATLYRCALHLHSHPEYVIGAVNMLGSTVN